MRFATIAVAALAIASADLCASIPAKAEPAHSHGDHAPGLVEAMLQVQTHHAKLWLAGNARNWELADYQVDELKELLEDIAKRIPTYRDNPVGKMIESTVMAPIGTIETAIKARDSKAFASGYDRLTAACNSCHEATGRGFIVIQRPASSAFPNQSFAPRRK